MLDWSLYLGLGQMSCAAAICCMSFVGDYLFMFGVEDLETGLKKNNKHVGNKTLEKAKTLQWLMPMCAVLRVLFAPALWFWLAEKGSWLGALTSVPVLCWGVLYFCPCFMLVSLSMMKGVRHFADQDKCIANWPDHTEIDRPYHGLFQTRALAATGGFLVEFGWHMSIIYVGNDSLARVGCISVSTLIWNLLMLLGGPILMLTKSPGPQCRDTWIAQVYIIVSLAACEAMVLLHHAWFALPQMMNSESKFGPYSHWSVLLWLLVSVAQVSTLHFCILQGYELKSGAPWSVGAADYKEFFYPRFWGLIFYCRGQFIAFNFWIVGCYMWTPQAVVYVA